MEIKLKKLEEIRKLRRISKENVFKENKKVPLLNNNKINDITFILNIQNFKQKFNFSSIRNEQFPQPI